MRVSCFLTIFFLMAFGQLNAAIIQFADLAGFNGATVASPGGQDFFDFDGMGTNLNIRGVGTFSGGAPTLLDASGDAYFHNRMDRAGGGAANVQSNTLFFTISGIGATLDAIRTDNAFGFEAVNVIETLTISAGGIDLIWSGVAGDSYTVSPAIGVPGPMAIASSIIGGVSSPTNATATVSGGPVTAMSAQYDAYSTVSGSTRIQPFYVSYTPATIPEPGTVVFGLLILAFGACAYKSRKKISNE